VTQEITRAQNFDFPPQKKFPEIKIFSPKFGTIFRQDSKSEIFFRKVSASQNVREGNLFAPLPLAISRHDAAGNCGVCVCAAAQSILAGMSTYMPADSDLVGALMSLVRIQTTYGLSVGDLAAGRIAGH